MKFAVLTTALLALATLSSGCAKQDSSSGKSAGTLSKDVKTGNLLLSVELKEPLKENIEISAIAVNSAPQGYEGLIGKSFKPDCNEIGGKGGCIGMNPIEVTAAVQKLTLRAGQKNFTFMFADNDFGKKGTNTGNEVALDVPIDPEGRGGLALTISYKSLQSTALGEARKVQIHLNDDAEKQLEAVGDISEIKENIK